MERASQGLILASASVRRYRVLKNIGLSVHAQTAAAIDETPGLRERPADLARRLAVEKAHSVARQYDPDHWVLAGDTVVACAQRILPKCETLEQAHACWQVLAGRRHRVYGGIALCHRGKTTQRVVTTIVKFRQLSRQEIAHYLQSREWHAKAGGYAIQGMAARFVLHINGSYGNVLGLCPGALYAMLRARGFDFDAGVDK